MVVSGKCWKRLLTSEHLMEGKGCHSPSACFVWLFSQYLCGTKYSKCNHESWWPLPSVTPLARSLASFVSTWLGCSAKDFLEHCNSSCLGFSWTMFSRCSLCQCSFLVVTLFSLKLAHSSWVCIIQFSNGNFSHDYVRQVLILDAFKTFCHGSILDKTVFCLGGKQGTCMLLSDEYN